MDKLPKWFIPAGIILSFVFMLIVSGLATLLPLNGLTTKELSDSFQVLFVPAGYVFSIWSVIYILLGVLAYWLIKNNSPKLLTLTYILSNILNGLWLFAWHYQQVLLSVIIMLALLTTLIVMYVRARKVKYDWKLSIPVSVYLGWISVATIANITSYLYSIGWDGFGITDGVWALIMLAIASILGVFMLDRNKDIPYTLVLVWAFVGITVKVQALDSTVAIVALLLALILSLDVLMTGWKIWYERMERTGKHKGSKKEEKDK